MDSMPPALVVGKGPIASRVTELLKSRKGRVHIAVTASQCLAALNHHEEGLIIFTGTTDGEEPEILIEHIRARYDSNRWLLAGISEMHECRELLDASASDSLPDDRLDEWLVSLASQDAERQKSPTAWLPLDFRITNSPVAVVEWDSDFRVTQWPGLAESVFGWKAEEVVGLQPGLWRFVHPDDVEHVNRVMTELKNGTVTHNVCTNRNLTRSGEVIWCDWHNTARIDRRGGPVSIRSVIHDITDRVQIEEKLRRSEHRYRSIFENNYSVMLLIDPGSGRIFDANCAAEKFYGWPRKTLRKMKIWDINTLSESQVRQRMSDAENARRNRFVFQHRLADGSVRDVEVLSGSIQFEQRTLLYSIIHDISAQLAAERALKESEEKFRNLIEGAPDAILMHRDAVVTYVNRTACRLFGAEDASQLTQRPLLDLIHPEYRHNHRDAISELLDSRTPMSPSEVQMLHLDGHSIPVEIACMPIHSNGCTDMLVFARDIRQRREAESGLRLASTAVNNTSDGIIITDADARIIGINPAFTEMTGFQESEVLGQDPKMLQSDRHNRDFYEKMWKDLLGKGRWRGEMWNRRKDGTIYPQFTRINAVHDDQGKLSHFVSVITDLSEIRSTEEQVEKLYYQDLLTGLANRQLFRARLERALAHAGPGNRAVCILNIDLDGFSHVNEGLGVRVGDHVLLEITRRLERLAEPDLLVARIGADEFAILTAGEERASVLSEDAIATLGTPIQVDDHTVFLTASVGMAISTDPNCDTESFMQHADAAVHQAKAEGGNTCRYYDRNMSRLARERVMLAAELRDAINTEQLTVHYQPQIELRSGSVIGLEALVRWSHPRHGLIPPDRFIPLAEDTGLIIDLGRWVLERTCRQARQWLDDGMAFASVAVNVSGAQVLRGNLADIVTETLSETGLPPEYLELELTESFVMESGEPLTSLFTRLGETGIRLAMDDFGTGYSSLAYLKQLPFDTLKLDQQFTRHVATDTKDAAICRVVTALGRELGFRTLAEGVETDAQRQVLIDLGCQFGQGYLFSKPVDAQSIPELIRLLSRQTRQH